MNRRRSIPLLLSLCLLLGAHAEGWNRFRGPNGSGVASGCQPPVEIGANTLIWKTPVPPGLSSPVVAGEKVFLTAVEKGRLQTLALDCKTGQILWRREPPEVALEKVHETSSPATPTPLVDADHLYVYFGSFGLLCYDHEGTEVWRKPLPPTKSLYGTACSPIAYRDTVLLVLDSDENLGKSKLSKSRIVALDRKTGEIRWETARPHHRSGWSTPAIWRHDGGEELVVLGSGRARGYDAATGTELWSHGGFSRESIALPVVGGGQVYIASAQLGGGADAEIDPAPFWEALLAFDTNEDGRLEQSEMTGDFTYPLRPELPPGHPGFGIPIPDDPEQRRKRRHAILGWVDKNKDNAWTREEFFAHLEVKQHRPLLVAIRPGGQGDIEQSHVAWELNRSIPEVPSPLYHEGLLYLVRNGGFLAAIDATDGAQIYRERLAGSGPYTASPVLADGHLYLVSERGKVSVVKAGKEYELVHEHDLEEPTNVTPAIDRDTLYLRSKGHLRAFRRKR